MAPGVDYSIESFYEEISFSFLPVMYTYSKGIQYYSTLTSHMLACLSIK